MHRLVKLERVADLKEAGPEFGDIEPLNVVLLANQNGACEEKLLMLRFSWFSFSFFSLVQKYLTRCGGDSTCHVPRPHKLLLGKVSVA